MIESPRWLASKGQLKKCLKELKTIAKVNKTTISDKILVSLNQETVEPEKNFGYMTLFSSRNLAKNSILTIIGWFVFYFNLNEKLF